MSGSCNKCDKMHDLNKKEHSQITVKLDRVSNIKLLFEKFRWGYELDDFYIDKILELTSGGDEDVNELMEGIPFNELLQETIQNMETMNESAQLLILGTIQNVIKLNQWLFRNYVNLPQLEAYLRRLNQPKTMSIPLRIAVLKLAIVYTNIPCGARWMAHRNMWIYIFHKDLLDSPKHIQRLTFQFITKLAWKLNEIKEEGSLMEFLRYVLKPIIDENLNEVHFEVETAINNEKTMSIRALLDILEESAELARPNHVIHLLSKFFFIDPRLGFYLKISRDVELVQQLCLLKFKICFYANRNLRPDSVNDITANYYNLLSILIHKRMIEPLLRFVVDCHIFWTQCGSKILPSMFENYGRKFLIQDQFVTILIVPLIIFAVENISEDEALKENLYVFFMKTNKLVNEHVLALGYSLRDILETFDKREVAITAIALIFRLKGKLNTEHAGILYQALYYVLRKYVVVDKECNLMVDSSFKSSEDMKVITLVISGIRMLLQEHEVHWYQNYEIVYLHSTLMNMLKMNDLEPKLIVQILDLIDIGIQKFLPPDLALLIERERSGTLSEIAQVVTTFVQSEHWEVRDSTLSMLMSCIEIAFVKYTPFQNLISASNLIVLAVNSLEDAEFYVQATALKCLASSSKIESMWKEVLAAKPNIHFKLAHIIKNHPEGIVRKEATAVFTDLYMHQKVSPNFTKWMCHVMSDAATDHHWEVQLSALTFWSKVIQNQFTERGMLDGKFPSVTFCKLKRKIIALTPQNIEILLAGIVKDISSLGCLAVLQKCLKEDCVEVLERAFAISKDLVNILDKYNLRLKPEDETAVSKEPDVVTLEAMDLSLMRLGLHDQRAQIIDDLLSVSFEDSVKEMKHKTHFDENFAEITRSSIEVMSPNEFLKTFRKTDYPSRIEAKKKWLSGKNDWDVLIDEILSMSVIPNINRMQLEC